MDIHKYKEILDICPIPYIWGKYIGDTEYKNVDYIIKGGNDLLLKKLKIENEYEILDRDLTSVLGMSKNELNLFLKEKDGKFTKYQYVCNLKDTYKITLNIDDEKNFYMWFQIYNINNNYNLAIQNNLKAIIWVKDINGRYIRVNKNFEKMMGIGKADIIGKKSSQINSNNEFKYIEEYEKLVLDKKKSSIEKVVFEENQWVSIFIYPMIDEDKNIIGTYGFKVYDYVNSKTAIGIENRNKMLEIIVDNLPIPIFYKDTHGVHLYCNEAFGELLELDRDKGIPNDKIDDVFEKFKQVDNRLTKISEGSGIGLSIVKSLVALHEGTINVHSEVGVGTEFKVKIPNKTIIQDENLSSIVNESIDMNKKIQIEFSDIY